MPTFLLLDRLRARFGGLSVLFARAAGGADRADDLAIHENRQSAFNWHGAFERKETEAGAARGERVLQGLGRPLEARRRARLVLLRDT